LVAVTFATSIWVASIEPHDPTDNVVEVTEIPEVSDTFAVSTCVVVSMTQLSAAAAGCAHTIESATRARVETAPNARLKVT
jgi:hypothetical protein